LVIRSTLGEAVLLVALAALPAIGEALYLRERVPWQEKPAAEEITVKEAQALGEKVMWVDARPENEFTAAHIPGAILLNTENWDSLLPQLLNTWTPDRELVVYCSKQTCGASQEVARRLREEAGLTNVVVLKGGWEAWQEASIR
jgi:rhodanese-related sulfurtransferase